MLSQRRICKAYKILFSTEFFLIYFFRNELPIHVQECVDCYIRPWKTVEFSQRNYSSSCFSRDRLDRGAMSPNSYQQEFEIDREFYSFEDNLAYKVRIINISRKSITYLTFC